jgi:NADPH:quinone reductase-like Zn-dependent oxidoreductase
VVQPRQRYCDSWSGRVAIKIWSNDEGSPVQSIADIRGAREHGVSFSRGDAGRAVHALAEIGELIESGRFSLPIVQTFPLVDVAEAHRVGERGHGRGKLISWSADAHWRLIP